MKKQRRPETQEAVEKFEKLSRLKVLEATCRTTGSMRPYVRFLIPLSNEEVWKRKERDRYDGGYQLGNVKATFVNGKWDSEKNGNSDKYSYVDVRWVDLGMVQPF